MKRMTMVVMIALMLAGCSSSTPEPEPSLPEGPSSSSPGEEPSAGRTEPTMATVTTPEIHDAYPQALLQGTLLAEWEGDVVYFIIEVEGERHGLILPAGYRASVGEDVTLLLSDEAEPLAEVGTDILVGGGQTPEGAEWAGYWGDGPEVDFYWLAAHGGFSPAEG